MSCTFLSLCHFNSLASSYHAVSRWSVLCSQVRYPALIPTKLYRSLLQLSIELLSLPLHSSSIFTLTCLASPISSIDYTSCLPSSSLQFPRYFKHKKVSPLMLVSSYLQFLCSHTQILLYKHAFLFFSVSTTLHCFNHFTKL